MPPFIFSKHPNTGSHNWLGQRITEQQLIQLANNFRGCVYDLGCGTQPYRDFVLAQAEQYVAVDWSNSYHNTHPDVIADLNQRLPIPSAVADTVMSISVMEHLCEPVLFLEEALRVLKPGGVIVLQVPFMWWEHEAPFDYFRFTRFGLKYVFQKAGFHDIEIFPTTGFWVMWTLKFNYQSARLVRGPWPVRKTIELFLRAIWAIDQRVSPLLDKYWKAEGETAGYFVVAKKE